MDEMRLLRSLEPAGEHDLDEVAGRPVFEELFGELIAGAPGAGLDSGLPASGARRAQRRRTRLVAPSLAALVASLAVVLAVASGVLSGPSLPKGSFTTPWRPSVPASAAPAPGSGSAAPDGFRLASYVTGGPHWSLAEGPVGLFNIVTCPSTSACYMTLTTPVPPSEVRTSSFYFSRDGGESWARLPLPSRLTLSSAQSCPSAEVCVAAADLDARIVRGQLSGQTVLVSTVDGGHRWSVVPAPFAGQLFLLSCTSARVCNGVTTSAAREERLVRTTNGGATWSVPLTLPASSEIYALSCPSPKGCVATGAYYRSGTGAPFDFAMFSDDGGARWAQAQMEGTPGTGLLSAVSCASATDCTAVSAYNALIAPLPAPGTTPVGSFSGPSELYSLRPNVAGTVNGGQTWHVEAFDLQSLAAVGAATGISAMVCPAEGAPPERCWPPTDGGNDLPPTPWMAWSVLATGRFVIGPGGFDCPASGRCALAGPWGLGLTANGGGNWGLQTLPAGSLTMQGHTPLVSVSCPALGQCVAISDPSGLGSPTPVYSSILRP
jgi:photosystem II stability/assembly factor-like uncharacterized protein